MKHARILLALAAMFSTAAQAHVLLDQTSAPAGSYQKLTFHVGHGCDGQATTGITVMLPESVTGAKPMPKAGWVISMVEGKLSVPVQADGKLVTSTVREITWKGGPLPDAYYDEFTLQAKVPEQPGKVYFKIIQQCEKTSVSWDEMPGDKPVKLKAPAPVLEVLPAAMPAGHHH